MMVATMPRKPKRNDLVVKIEAEVVRMARIIAAYEDKQIAELLSDILRPILTQRLQRHQEHDRRKAKAHD